MGMRQPKQRYQRGILPRRSSRTSRSSWPGVSVAQRLAYSWNWWPRWRAIGSTPGQQTASWRLLAPLCHQRPSAPTLPCHMIVQHLEAEWTLPTYGEQNHRRLLHRIAHQRSACSSSCGTSRTAIRSRTRTSRPCHHASEALGSNDLSNTSCAT